MPAVQADAVTVLLEAKIQQYQKDIETAAAKTEAVFKRIRAQAAKPITLSANVQASETETRTVEKNANRKTTAAKKAAQNTIDANKKAADAEIANQERITAAVERGIARRNAAIAKGSGTIRDTGTPGLAAQQNAFLRRSSALGTGGSMAAPTSPEDKVDFFRRDQIDTIARLNAAQAAGNKEEATALRDQLTQFRLINQYRKAGLDESEASIRAEEKIADIQRRRANRSDPAPQATRRTLGGELGSVARTVRNVTAVGFAAYGGVQSAREYLELTDAYKQYNAQLKLATAENGNLAQAQADTQRIATTTRSGLAETASLYATFQRNAGQLGLTQIQSARATETVTKAFQISGATAQEASGGLRQFLQGLQSGTLRGEEFNSVVENAPRLAKLLADQLTNGNIGALRALSAAGKITGDDLKKALTDQKFTDQIDKEFQQLPVTFDQAMTVVKNAAITTFGEFDQGGQFSTALANFITQGSDGFSGLAKGASDLGIEIRSQFAGLSDAFEPLINSAQRAFGLINSSAVSSTEYIRSALKLVDDFRNAPGDLVRNFGKQTGLDQSSAGRAILGNNQKSDLAGRFSSGQRLSAAQLRVNREVSRLEALGYTVPKNTDGSVNISGIKAPTAARNSSFAPAVAARVNPDLKKYQDQIADLEKLKASASGKELTTINKQIARRQAIVANLQKGVSLAAATAAAGGVGGKGTSEETLAKRAKALADKKIRNDEAFNSEIEQLRQMQIVADREQTSDIATLAQFARDDIASAERKRIAQIDADEATGKYTKAQADQARLATHNLASAQLFNEAVDERVKLEQQNLEKQRAILSNQEDTLSASVEGLENRKLQQSVAKQLLDLRYRELRDAQNAIINSSDPKVTADQRQAARDRLPVIDAQEAGANRQLSIENRTAGQKYAANLNSADSLADEIDGIKIEVLDQVADKLTNATTAALGLSGALGDIVGQIIKIGIQRAIIAPIANSLFGKADGSSGGGGIGSAISSIAGLFGGARASGGNVSAGTLYKINENGTEGFQPAQSGKIIPLGRMSPSSGGGTTVVQNISVDGRNSVTPTGFAQSILTLSAQQAQNAAKTAYSAGQSSTPGRLKTYNQLES